ncbi:MAG: zinc ribbon domain-containing protein [Chloroflexi bacterium]|nr:MAG: zinc ribbon domain-containing protein [Chloroflexota bacterium]
MPIYEYLCANCRTRFEALRPKTQADAPIPCPSCGSRETSRTISLFAAHAEGRVVAGSSGCGSCTPSAACATCLPRR